jgi:predicted nucleic acid-binding protein
VIYIDTSVLGAIFFREASAAASVARLEDCSNQSLRISAWSLTEFASIGAIKQRMGHVDATARQYAMATFQRFAPDNLHLAEVDPADFRVAVSIIDGSANLRSGDALHLAIARRLGAALMTLDRRQAEAASGAGVKLA